MSEAKENPLEIELQSALVEYMSECDSKVLPDRESFLARHPELRDQLEQLLAAADWIESLAGPTAADLSKKSESGELEQTLPLTPADMLSLGDSPTLSVGSSENLDLSYGDDTIIPPIRGLLDSSLNTRAELSQPSLPCRFGDYLLERVLGRGGMGVVYFGRQVHLDRPVAIKMIRSGALASDEEVHRFYAEARSAAKLNHPNIVTVYQCGEHEGHHYFSMDYIEGKDLYHIIQSGPLEDQLAARYVRDVARAIEYAHERGILHRDLKPANVLIDEQDRVQITDFGLAKLIGHESGLTAEGAALGTPSYMSPEQAAGKVEEHGRATDVYSLGAVLFTIVTGQPPFRGTTILQTIMQVIHRPAPLARSLNPKVGRDLETIVDRCLQKNPVHRYPSAKSVADDLERFLNGKPIEARPLPTYLKAWHWLLGVPIFGAILDNRVVEPTEAHRWVQRGLIASTLLLCCAWMMLIFSNRITNRLPKSIKVAAGASGGGYERVATTICNSLVSTKTCEASLVNTEGSLENIEHLLNSKADLALLQANTVRSSSINVVAPLFYEAVHVIAKAESDIVDVKSFRNKRVLWPHEKSGSYAVAKLLLEHNGLTAADIQPVPGDWKKLNELPVDAAIVVVQAANPVMHDLLASGAYRLLPIADAVQFSLDEPMFHPLQLHQSIYPRADLPESGTISVATTAFLAARSDAPDVLVEKVLEQLFQPDSIEQCKLFSPEQAAHWQGIAWHPAAQRFFEGYRKSQ